MKILIVAPKQISINQFDYAIWNFYLPLISLGHEVNFFDSSIDGSKELACDIEHFKPDLLFCIMTGDRNYCPNEPWEIIQKETQAGRVITFNWYCDDSWRFDSFSSKTCDMFNFCSTPERKFVDLYEKIGYNNCIYSTWHANEDLYSLFVKHKKNKRVCFIGQKHSKDRISYLEMLSSNKIDIFSPDQISFETMILAYSESLIGINFCKNHDIPQIKARIFEIAATGSLLFCERSEDICSLFEENKEIILFSSKEECLQKIKFILENEKLGKEIAQSGYKRYIQEHTSKKRLSSLISRIFS